MAITPDKAKALLRQQNIHEILEQMPTSSLALNTFRRVSLGSSVTSIPVLATLPEAKFVTDDIDQDTSKKPVSGMEWKNKNLRVEELAVIIPIHENTFEDSEYNIWEAVKPRIAEAFAKKLDAAVFFGVDKPTQWDEAIVKAAVTAGNVAYEEVEGQTGRDLADAINDTWALVEGDGFDVTANYATRSLRSRLRGLRDKNGGLLYLDSVRDDHLTSSVYGEPIYYGDNGAWNNTEATLVAGDRDKAIIGLRSDITFKVLTEATVGNYNLAEKDMLALRAKMRVAFAVASPVTATGGSSAYPFAVLKPGKQA